MLRFERPRCGRPCVATPIALLLAAALASGADAHAAHGHPTRIHEGACDELGPAVFTLNGVGAWEDESGAPIATPEAVNSRTAYQVVVGHSTVEASLADLLAGPHALVLYDSDETMQTIACGNLGGARLGDELIVGLAELGVPGHSGIAVLRDEGEQTDVTIFLGHGLAPVSAGGAMGETHDHDTDEMEMDGAATPGAEA